MTDLPPTVEQQNRKAQAGHSGPNKASSNHDHASSYAGRNTPPPKAPVRGNDNGRNAGTHQPEPSVTEKLTLLVNFLTLIAVAVYTVFTGALLFDGRRAAETQRQHAELQTRPWMKIEDLQISGDILTGRDEWLIGITATLRNVGATPAREIWFGFDAFPLDSSVREMDVQIQKFLRYTCDAFRDNEDVARDKRAFSFPGEVPVLSAFGNVDRRLREKKQGSVSVDVRRAIFVGFAVYNFSAGENKHCSASAYTLSRRNQRALTPLSRDDVIIVDGQTRDGVSKDALIFTPFPLGGVYAD